MRNGAVRVDAHHHFWDPARYAYPWMEGSAMGPVRRRFSPEDLVGELAKSDIDGTVLVQTLSSLDESRELLETASRWEWVRGVVAWVDPAADDVPELLFVVDHIAKPRIAGRSDPAWEAGMPELAALGNVQVKLSGMVTEADWTSWSPDDLRPFVSRVVELFGAHRLMFGSDWPVCLLVVPSYQGVIAALEEALGDLSDDESRQVFGANAQRFYGLALPPQ